MSLTLYETLYMNLIFSEYAVQSYKHICPEHW